MNLPNIFTPEVADAQIARINKINTAQSPQWGKMDAAQMFAHLNVTYEMGYDDNFKKSNPFIRFILKNLVKKNYINDAPLKKNSSTAPEMLITTTKIFDVEKSRLIANIQKLNQVGGQFFDGRDHPGFGKMSTQEWATFYYKHLDHHLTQFGV